MQFKNDSSNYGLVSITLHWVMAVVIVGLFALGYWMCGLSYYDEWYRFGPYIHKSIGILLSMTLAFRLVWRFSNVKPVDEEGLHVWEKHSAYIVHWLLYGLLLAVVISGYLISTADGRAIDVFTWFEVPALFVDFENQEDLAGLIHEYLAYSVIGLATLHGLAAMKHHFADKDNTLKKMLGTSPKENEK